LLNDHPFVSFIRRMDVARLIVRINSLFFLKFRRVLALTRWDVGTIFSEKLENWKKDQGCHFSLYCIFSSKVWCRPTFWEGSKIRDSLWQREEG